MSQVSQPRSVQLSGKLPNELLIQILEHAVEVPGETWFKDKSMKDAFFSNCRQKNWRSKNKSNNLVNGLIVSSSSRGYSTRNALHATCRFSRLLSLKAWKVGLLSYEYKMKCGYRYEKLEDKKDGGITFQDNKEKRGHDSRSLTMATMTDGEMWVDLFGTVDWLIKGSWQHVCISPLPI